MTVSAYPLKTGQPGALIGGGYPVGYPAKNPAPMRVYRQLGYPGYPFYIKDLYRREQPSAPYCAARVALLESGYPDTLVTLSPCSFVPPGASDAN